MTLTITISSDVPDGTYFRTAAVEPELDGDTLTIYSGTGTRRSWGQPGVTSTIVLQAEDLVAIHIGFFHKHGGGQFWRYFQPVEGAWQHREWKDISDPDRQRVIDAYISRAANWAKAPGKLRAEHKKPEVQTRTSYKLVRVEGERYFSVYDPDVEYVLGKRLAEKAQDDHNGGFYSYPSVNGVKGRFENGTLFPERCYSRGMRLALIECEISGTMIEYAGKIASTYLRPIKVLEIIDYIPVLQEAC